MTHDLESTGSSATPLTDDRIAALVRDAADDWQMPPIPLQHGGWEARVRTGRWSRVERGTRVAQRLGRGLVVAIVLIVVAAVAGVWLNLPRNSGVASIPVSPPSRASVDPSASSVPLSLPAQVLVRYESGYAVVDLAKGAIGSGIGLGQYGSVMRQLADGSFVCICLSSTGSNGYAASYSAEWQKLDATGAILAQQPIGTFTGSPDPRGQGLDAYQNATAEVSAGPGNTVYVGWSTREHPAWHSGLVAVDISNGDVLQRMDLPDRDDGSAEAALIVDGPRVVGSAGNGRVLIDREWHSDGPAVQGQPVSFEQGFDAFAASSSTMLGTPMAFDGLRGCGSNVTRAGSLSDGGWWAACFADNGTTIRRFDTSDVAVRDNQLPNYGLDAFSIDSVAAVDATGTAAYAWDPIGLRLTKLDLATGRTTVGDDPAADNGLLARIGAWLTPSVTAKIFLTPSLALSPDGTRAYGLGIESPTREEATGSIGVTVIDTDSMDVVAHWPAEADYESIAASADGGLVFLAAAPTIGSQPPGASITALDAVTGSVAAVVGGLGGQGFYFTDPLVP